MIIKYLIVTSSLTSKAFSEYTNRFIKFEIIKIVEIPINLTKNFNIKLLVSTINTENS